MKFVKILPGPELYWIILYVAAVLFASANRKSGFAYDPIIENVWLYVPLFSLLIFGFYWIPFVEKNFLLLRIWITSTVSGHLILEKILSSCSQQGPGIGMAYLAGMLFLFILLVLGSIIIKFVF